MEERIEKCMQVSNGSALDLSDLDLSSLPDEVLELSSLTSINLRNNQLQELPMDFVDNFPKLQVLNVSQNKLTALPEDLAMLSDLKKIYLQGNDITSLPESFPLHLEELYAQSNQVTELPLSLSHLKQLQTLSIANNQLKKIPLDFSNLRGLQVVDLSGNPLTYVPERIRRLHDKHALLHSRSRRRELISRNLRVRGSVDDALFFRKKK